VGLLAVACVGAAPVAWPILFLRYLLIQLPGYVILALAMTALHLWLGLALWICAVAMAAWIVKDIALFPLVRRSYDIRQTPVRQEGLVGTEAVAEEDLDPSGYVRVRGELWRARLRADEGEVHCGERLRVRGLEGMTLVVERDAPE
jgi:membrane protein implicated in regulation of membrane protease activity